MNLTNSNNSKNQFFRLDRFLSLYFFHLLFRSGILRGCKGIPILMYHSISEPSEGNRAHPYYETCTSPRVFAEHMQFLHDGNYHVISLDQAVSLLKESKSPNEPNGLNEPNRASFVVLTFDDGFEDFYSKAFPILESLGFCCIVYLPTAAVGNDEIGLMRKKHLSWNQVRELHSYGVSFGSHTVNHPQLAELKNETVEMELSKSKEEIEQQLGNEVSSFSYPYAFPEENIRFVNPLREMLQSIGYLNGVTTKIGLSGKQDDPLFLRRIPVNVFDDLPFFRVKTEGAYDWLHGMQRMFKFSKKMSRS